MSDKILIYRTAMRKRKRKGRIMGVEVVSGRTVYKILKRSKVAWINSKDVEGNVETKKENRTGTMDANAGRDKASGDYTLETSASDQIEKDLGLETCERPTETKGSVNIATAQIGSMGWDCRWDKAANGETFELKANGHAEIKVCDNGEIKVIAFKTYDPRLDPEFQNPPSVQSEIETKAGIHRLAPGMDQGSSLRGMGDERPQDRDSGLHAAGLEDGENNRNQGSASSNANPSSEREGEGIAE